VGFSFNFNDQEAVKLQWKMDKKICCDELIEQKRRLN